MAASTAAWTMLFGVVAIVLPPAPAWTSRYVPVHPAFLLRRHHRSNTGSSSCWASSESWPSLGRGSPQRSSPTLPLPIPTVSPLLTPVASRNLLLYQSLPTSVRYRHANWRRRKDDPCVGTAARRIIA